LESLRGHNEESHKRRISTPGEGTCVIVWGSGEIGFTIRAGQKITKRKQIKAKKRDSSDVCVKREAKITGGRSKWFAGIQENPRVGVTLPHPDKTGPVPDKRLHLQGLEKVGGVSQSLCR